MNEFVVGLISLWKKLCFSTPIFLPFFRCGDLASKPEDDLSGSYISNLITFSINEGAGESPVEIPLTTNTEQIKSNSAEQNESPVDLFDQIKEETGKSLESAEELMQKTLQELKQSEEKTETIETPKREEIIENEEETPSIFLDSGNKIWEPPVSSQLTVSQPEVKPGKIKPVV